MDFKDKFQGFWIKHGEILVRTENGGAILSVAPFLTCIQPEPELKPEPELFQNPTRTRTRTSKT